MTDLATGFAESVAEGQIEATEAAWKAFQIGALYAGLSVTEAIHAAAGQSDEVRLKAAISALICVDLDTDMPCSCPVQAVA